MDNKSLKYRDNLSHQLKCLNLIYIEHFSKKPNLKTTYNSILKEVLEQSIISL